MFWDAHYCDQDKFCMEAMVDLLKFLEKSCTFCDNSKSVCSLIVYGVARVHTYYTGVL